MDWTRDQVEAIIAETKYCSTRLEWKPLSSQERRYLLEGTVLIPSRERLGKLRGTMGKKNYSFAFLVDNVPFRIYTVHYCHTNPDGRRIKGPHKHTWHHEHEARIAYVPEDIDPKDLNRAFLDFLRETNIVLQGGDYQTIIP